MSEACYQARSWQSGGRAPLRVSVNLSSRQFRSEGLIKAVGGALRARGLAPGLLELELTESLLVENVDHAMDLLHKLKALGASISIDDFGTGYSSLGHLKRFPIDSSEMQGYFFSRPLAPEAVPEALVRNYPVPRAISASAAIHSGDSLRHGTA